MKTKFNGILTLLLALVVQISFAQDRTISGTISDETGPLPGVTVLKKGTTQGTETDFDGNYTIKAKTGDVLVFSFVGMKTTEKTVGTSAKINLVMENDNVLNEVVVTALGLKQNTKKLAYAAQSVVQDDLNTGQESNIKSAIAGKIAGAQVASQAGSKLGSNGNVYLRGAISAKGREEALYVVDGVVTNSSNVDLDNVENVTVLKGPNANALYGLRAAGGVIVITTKAGKRGKVNVTINNSITFDNAAYVPDYQNEYGQGYSGSDEWDTYSPVAGAPAYFDPLIGADYIHSAWADESWGPKFDGRDYAPWYSWFPGDAENPNPYYGKTAKWEAKPNNIKNYFETATTVKNSFDLSGGGDNYRARLSYVNLDQSGLLPNSGLKKNTISAKFDVDLSDKFNIGANVIYTSQKVNGDFGDGYSNVTTGSFNAWFARDLDMGIMKELKDLKTPNGHTASWNWWGPFRYSLADRGTHNYGYVKPTFWYNPYWHTDQENFDRKTDRVVASLNASYKIADNLTLRLNASRNGFTYDYERYTPYSLENSANAFEFGYTDYVNSFDVRKQIYSEITVSPSIDYTTNFNDNLKLDVTAGYIDRNNTNKRTDTFMASTGSPRDGESVGLVIPDYYNFSNSRENITPGLLNNKFRVKSLFSRIGLSYKDYLNFNFDIRNDWDSRYDVSGAENTNSFLFGSAGVNLIFSKLIGESETLSFGKVWVNYARVGTEADTYQLNPTYPAGPKYNGIPTQYTAASAIAPDVSPATSGSLEIGTDLRLFNNKLNLNVTYYNEDREDEILNSAVPSASGNNGLIANAGLINRTGVEAVIGYRAINNDNLKWDVTLNLAKNTTTVESLAAGTESYNLGGSSFSHIALLNRVGKEWGQLEGGKIKRDDNGNKVVNASGLYVVEAGASYGSVLPEFNGGLFNKLSYKGLTLAATITFQKGGKFYSLTENWMASSGLADETAGLNDKGSPIRDAVADGGGVHVTGVDEAGANVDMYVDAHDYFPQFQNNSIAEPFVHDASYIKLSDISLTYKLPKKWLGNTISNVSVGLIARNLGLLSVSSDNKNSWDPSEMSQTWGENGQLPGTRSYGFNVKLGF